MLQKQEIALNKCAFILYDMNSNIIFYQLFDVQNQRL